MQIKKKQQLEPNELPVKTNQPIISSEQSTVASKQNPSAKKRKGFYCIVGLLSISGVAMLLAAVALPNLVNCTGKAKQAEAKQNVRAMTQAQQAYFSEKHDFAKSIENLELGIKSQTVNYNYSIYTTSKATFSYGIARNNRIRSYVGGVFTVPTKEIQGSAAKNKIETLSILCEANSLGTSKLANPTYTNGAVACGTNTHNLIRH